MADKKSAKKSKTAAKSSKVPKIKDLSPRKNPRGGDGGRPHNYGSGGGTSDE